MTTTTATPIYLKETDVETLQQCVRESLLLPDADVASLKLLAAELDRAVTVPDSKFPPDAVSLHSTVEVEYCDDGEIALYRPVPPYEAGGQDGDISVLTPLGLALLGCRENQRVEWPLNRGVLQVRIRSVNQEG